MQQGEVAEADATAIGRESRAAPNVPAGTSAAVGRSAPLGTTAPVTSTAHAVEPWNGGSITSELERPLRRTLLDPVVSHADVARVLEGLSHLPRRAFAESLAELSAHGTLGTLLCSADATQRAAFLGLAADQGVLERVPGRVAEGPLGPPAAPPTFRMRHDLPGEVNEAIHDDALAGAARYASAYGEYQQRYADAVGRCESGEALRRLGPHAAPLAVSEAVDPHDPSAARYQREWSHHALPSDKPARDAVEARRAQLAGERPDSWLEGRVRLSRGTHVAQAKVDTGMTGDHVVVSAGQRVARPGGEALVLSGGEVEGAVRWSGGGAFTVEQKDGRLSSVAVRAGGYGLSVSETRVGFSAPISHGFTATSFADPRSGTFGAGVSAALEFGALGAVDGSFGVATSGVSRSTAREVGLAESYGLFDRPPELVRGAAWADLSSEERARAQSNLWTEDEWTRARR